MSTTISEARREANRRNARKSTGPRTEAGKAASRRNALRHGLTAEVVELEADSAGDSAGVPAVGAVAWPGWLAGQVARAMMQIDRAQAIEARLREEAVFRALDSWDDDQVVWAEELGARLARDPGRVVARLRRTPHGCDWLIARWEALAGAADWTPAQAELARDLLATPPEFRPDPADADLGTDADGRAATIPSPAGLARGKVAELQAHRGVVAAADEAARAMVVAGLADAPTRELANLRRYERAALRRLEWVQDQMDRAGLRPRPRSAAPQPAAAPVAPASAPESCQPTGTPATGRVGPAPSRALGETKPLAAPGPGPAAPESRPRRPDLDKFRRRNRRSA